MKYLSFDPGNSTGIVYHDESDETYIGMCIKEDLLAISHTIEKFSPDQVIIETFQLYPGKAKSMSWNTFYPCEVIGVIKHTCEKMNIPFEMQSAGIKPYSVVDAKCPKGNDHIRDAYRHLWYYLTKKRTKK